MGEENAAWARQLTGEIARRMGFGSRARNGLTQPGSLGMNN